MVFSASPSCHWVLDLGKHIEEDATALVGREAGRKLKDDLEKKGLGLSREGGGTIVIPERIITINLSFFAGLFEEILVNEMGGDTWRFRRKYHFVSSKFVEKRIEAHARRLTSTPVPNMEIRF